MKGVLLTIVIFLSLNAYADTPKWTQEFLSTSDINMYYGREGNVLKKKQLMGINYDGFSLLCQKDFDDENTIYVITRKFLLTEDILIPNNCILMFKGGSIGGKFSLKGENTKIEAELAEIFTDNLIINGTWNNDCSYSQWFDFSKDGSYDDTQNFQNLINFTGEVYIEPGIDINIGSILYPSINSNGNASCRLHSNTTIIGNKATIKLASGILLSSNTNLLWSDENISNVKLYDLCFDGNSKNNKFGDTRFARTSYFVYIDGGKDVTIEKCKFFNTAGRNCVVLNRKSSGDYHNAHINDCYFKNGGAYVSDGSFNSSQNDISFFYTDFENTVIENCVFVNCDLDTHEDIEGVDYETRCNYIKNPAISWGNGGVELHASNCKCLNNTFLGCNIGCYIARNNYTHTLRDIEVSGNNISFCSLGINIYPQTNCEDVRVLNNNITISGTNATQQMGIGVTNQPALCYLKNAHIANNNILSLEPSNTACLIKLFVGENITVTNNTLYASTNEHAISIIDYRAKPSGLKKAVLKDYVIANNKIAFAANSPQMSAIHCDYSVFYGVEAVNRSISNISVHDNTIQFNNENKISNHNEAFSGLQIFNNIFRNLNVSDIKYYNNKIWGNGEIIKNSTDNKINYIHLKDDFNFIIVNNYKM